MEEEWLIEEINLRRLKKKKDERKEFEWNK